MKETPRSWHIAQFNIGRVRAPLDNPSMAGFVNQLDAINAIADAAPGFVWRLQNEDGDATSFRPYDDDSILVNMSVWSSIEALHDYVYRSVHVGPIRDRKQWFLPLDRPHQALWWIPAGHIPTVEEAVERLELIRHRGPSPQAFTFQKRFPPATE
ncbi:MAG: DUF3291 domain-containing protein [Thermoanaerobaculia bacterium]|nr:DUF3291 domain-containing protein [Thermoanaerobaculia bacterium]